jgi:hypothetical protein
MERDRSGGYEFGPGESAEIAGLAGAMRFVGVAWVILGVINVVRAFLSLGRGGPEAVLTMVDEVLSRVVVGALFLGAGAYFKQIARTRGGDIPLLMAALGKLRSAFSLLRIVIVLALVLAVLAFVLFMPRAVIESSGAAR